LKATHTSASSPPASIRRTRRADTAWPRCANAPRCSTAISRSPPRGAGPPSRSPCRSRFSSSPPSPGVLATGCNENGDRLPGWSHSQVERPRSRMSTWSPGDAGPTLQLLPTRWISSAHRTRLRHTGRIWPYGTSFRCSSNPQVAGSNPAGGARRTSCKPATFEPLLARAYAIPRGRGQRIGQHALPSACATRRRSARARQRDGGRPVERGGEYAPHERGAARVKREPLGAVGAVAVKERPLRAIAACPLSLP
jgi:hypothetical protein